MNNLLIVVPSCADDAPIVERMMDWIYQLSGRQQQGHVLLAYAHDLHAEMRLKLRICAELAFETVSEFQANAQWVDAVASGSVAPKTKVEFINNLWQQTARHVAGHFRFPWLWLEPDCVPLTPDWMTKIADGYARQPRKFFGSHMKRKVNEAESLFLSRTSVYPVGAFNEYRKYIGSPPLEWTAAQFSIPRSTKTRLIQQMAYDGEFSKVRPDAVLLHSDKSGRLIEHLRNNKVEAIAEHVNGESVEVKMFQSPVVDESGELISFNRVESLRGSQLPGIANLKPVVPDAIATPDDPEPPDKRTREWKQWKARQAVSTQ